MTRNNRTKMVVLGEIGELLDNISMSDFVAKLTSKNRKEDGLTIVEAQTLNQVHATKHGATIQGNCYTKMFMHQTADALAHAEKKGWFKPSAYLANLLTTIHVAKGQYSEVCIMSGDKGAAVVRLVETPINRVLYNTEGPIFKELQRRVRESEPIEEYVHQQAEMQYGDGTYD